MPQIKFTGVFLRTFGAYRDKSGPFLRLEFTANYTKDICEVFGWDVEPAVKRGDLIGSLVASKLILTPKKGLSKDELELDITGVGHFTVHVLQAADGESSRTELRFHAKTVSQDMAGVIETFYRLVTDEAKGSLKVTYSEQKQMDLEPAEPEAQGEGAEE